MRAVGNPHHKTPGLEGSIINEIEFGINSRDIQDSGQIRQCF